jgi:alpha-tubulin suppressor-like RCC1 family protein
MVCATLLLSAAPALAQTIAAGGGHMVVAKSDGTVWTYGLNDTGQLGDNTQVTSGTPLQVSGLSDVIAVAAGNRHSMALTSTGNLYVWGNNANGQVGDASTTMRKTPVQSNLTNVVR